MEFAEWLSEQKFTVTDEIRPEQFPHPKNNLLFQIACQTGVLKKVYVVRCPVCGEKIGMYMEKDKDLMPSKSVCLNKHIFDTFQSAENNVVYCIKEKVAHIYY